MGLEKPSRKRLELICRIFLKTNTYKWVHNFLFCRKFSPKNGRLHAVCRNFRKVSEQIDFQLSENQQLKYRNVALARYPLAIPLLRFTSYRNTFFMTSKRTLPIYDFFGDLPKL